ncbi:MAG: hypothetical protein QGG25_09620 [Phycisphaerae bacterium]|jgi:hypothetical protein|nr:hypothetical protein [Phycisphaerae bacterium]
MSPKPFSKRLIYVLLAALLLAPAAYFICGGVVFYLFYTSYEDSYDPQPSFDIEHMERDGADGMKNVFSIAGWSGVGVVSLFCLYALRGGRSSQE